jgi:hypothetical protein
MAKYSMRPPASLALLVGLALLPAPVTATDLVRDPRSFLVTEGGFSPLELADLDHGQVVARIIDTTDRSEVLSVAALRVKTTAERVRLTLRDVEGRRKDFEVLQIGRFSSPPSEKDIEALTLDTKDVDGLRKCRVGSCTERLPKDAIERFQSAVDWQGAGYAERVTRMWRETLAAYAASYVARGNSGLTEYDDNRAPEKVGDTVSQLILRSSYLKESVPDLHRYLGDFPEAKPQATEDIVYWLKERFWLKNVQSLNHLSIESVDLPSGKAVVAVTKQIFANHFFAGSLALTAFVEGQDPSGSYLVFVNRTRADIRPTGFNWLERALVKRLVRRRLLGQFRAFKAKLDPSYPAPPPEEDLPVEP